MGSGTVFTRVSEMLAIATCLFHIQTLWASKMLRGTILLPRTIPGMWLMADNVLYFTSLSLDPSHAMGGHLPYACQKHSAKWPLSFLPASAFLCPDLSAVGWPQAACYPTSGVSVSVSYTIQAPAEARGCTLSIFAPPPWDPYCASHRESTQGYWLHWTEWHYARFLDTFVGELRSVHQIRPWETFSEGF